MQIFLFNSMEPTTYPDLSGRIALPTELQPQIKVMQIFLFNSMEPTTYPERGRISSTSRSPTVCPDVVYRKTTAPSHCKVPKNVVHFKYQSILINYFMCERYHSIVRCIPVRNGTLDFQPNELIFVTSSSFRGVPSGFEVSNCRVP